MHAIYTSMIAAGESTKFVNYFHWNCTLYIILLEELIPMQK